MTVGVDWLLPVALRGVFVFLVGLDFSSCELAVSFGGCEGATALAPGARGCDELSSENRGRLCM